MNEFLSRLPDDLKETTNPMMCSLGKCRGFETDQEPKSSRHCAECNRLHPPGEGDLGRFKQDRQAS